MFSNTSIELKQIDVGDLEIGMYVSKLDRPWLETTFLFQGFELKTVEDIKEVQKQCEFVYIDVTKQNKSPIIKARNTPYSRGTLYERPVPKKSSNFREEFHQAESLHEQASGIVKGFMEEVALGRSINVQIAKQAVSKCVESIMKSPDALMWMTQLKNRDEYTAQHSMNVCILSIALARQLGLEKEELEDVGLCGMMHDMGKMKVPPEILNKPGKLEAEELAIMRSHPTLGMKLLMSSRDMPGCAIDAAYGHHERMDGKGYPRGLTAERIHSYTRIVAIADTYDAINSDRVYQNGRTHLETIKLLTEAGVNHLDPEMVKKFIECLGVYPPGNIVEMTNGEIAVVIEENPTKKLKPKVTLLLNEDKKRVKPRLINLAKMDLDASGNGYVIKRMVRPDEYDINLKQLHKMGLINDTLAI